MADPPPPQQNPVSKIQLPPKPTVMITVSSSSSSSAASPSRRSPASTGRHPTFRGIRSRSGKWVSEIREPRKSKRIWLGTYPTPEMAAAAYDVAALSLKGNDTVLNFPDLVGSYQVPALPEPAMIRSAAGAAAELMVMKSSNVHRDVLELESAPVSDHHHQLPVDENDFMDLDTLFDPNLLVDMAEGMLMSPPPQHSAEDRSPGDDSSDCDHLWSY